jgi:hypothetical protein
MRERQAERDHKSDEDENAVFGARLRHECPLDAPKPA